MGGMMGGIMGGEDESGNNGSIKVGDISINFPSMPKPSNSPVTINTPSPYESVV